MCANQKNVNRRRLPMLAISLTLIAGGCGQVGVDPASAPQPAPAPVSPAPLVTAPAPTPTPTYTPPPTAPTYTPPQAAQGDQQLATMVAGNSLRGTNPAGDDYCTYYAPDGNLMTVLRGSSPEAGSWSVTNGTVCERHGVGATDCSQFAFQPSAQSVTITPVQGGVARQTTATVSPGNSCVGF